MMFNYIRKVLGMCEHEWKPLKEIHIYRNEGDKLPIATRYVFMCSKCCKLKSKKI